MERPIYNIKIIVFFCLVLVYQVAFERSKTKKSWKSSVQMRWGRYSLKFRQGEFFRVKGKLS